MKNIFKLMMLPLLAAPLLLGACSEDTDSNPTLDLSHVSDGFVLNTPANAENNTYDLANADGLELTCTQPNYGQGVPYVVNYYVQVAIDKNFLTDTTTTHTELASTYTTAKMDVNASELNSALVELWQSAHPDESVPESMPVYVRLRACIDGTADPYLGQTYSNIITLPSVKAKYVAPDATYPDNLFVIGSSIQTAWTSWKVVPPVFGISGNYYTMIYVPAGGSFKWGTFNNDWRGYNRLTAINDYAKAGISESTDGNSNIVVENGGWYVLHFVGDITPDGKNINYTLNIYPGAAYVIGTVAGGDWTTGWELSAPETADGEWVSPAFTAAGELRAYIKIPGIDWYRTEFSIYQGACYFRNVDIPNNWNETMGSEYSVNCAVGQKLYVNFDANTAEVR